MSFTLLDGGMGQELVSRLGRTATPLWSVDVLRDRPELVEQVHVDFLEAGADVITLSSYAATPSRLAQAGCEHEFDRLQAAAIDAALRARDKMRDRKGAQVRIAGTLPPLPGSYRPEERAGVDDANAEYERIAAAQADAVDLFLCETMPSIEETRLATRVARQSGKPVWTALTVDEADGRILRSGEALEEAAAVARAEGADAVLINCSPPEAVTAGLRVLASGPSAFGAYANAFTTVKPMKRDGTVNDLTTRDDLSPEAYADIAMGWAAAGAAIIGGCCAITPAHIAAINARRQRFDTTSAPY